MSIDTQRVQLLMMGMLLSPAGGVLLQLHQRRRHILRCSALQGFDQDIACRLDARATGTGRMLLELVSSILDPALSCALLEASMLPLFRERRYTL